MYTYRNHAVTFRVGGFTNGLLVLFGFFFHFITCSLSEGFFKHEIYSCLDVAVCFKVIIDLGSNLV